jgi:transcription initiation factor TFIIB
MEQVVLEEVKDYGLDHHCPNCGDVNIISDYQTGERICGKCGLVLEQNKFDESGEWRAFNAEEVNKRERVGPPTNPSRRDQFYTNMYGFKDGNGKTLSIDSLKKMQRLNRVNNISQNDDSIARNLKIAGKAMRMLTDKLGLSDGIFEDAFKLYRMALDKDLIRGKTIEGFVAASLLVVIRERGIPRSIIEIASTIDVDTHVVARLYRELLRDFNLKMPIDEPTKYFDKISTRFVLEPQIRGRALEILRDAKTRGMIQGKRPKSIAAAALYLAVKENYIEITQKKIAEASEISEVTLRTRVCELAGLTNLKLI